MTTISGSPTYRIWCAVWGGVTGSREAWLKEDGKVWSTSDRAEAEAKAAECRRLVADNTRASFSYEVQP